MPSTASWLICNNSEYMGSHINNTASRRRRVLIADDLLLNRMCLKTILEVENLEVSEAGDGKEALDRLQREAFALAIIDLEMPGMNGGEVLAHYRKDIPNPIPVYIVSTDLSMVMTERLLAAGAAGVLDRPLSIETIRMAIRSSH